MMAVRIVIGLLAILLGGCRTILGVDDPTIEARFDDAPPMPDAAIDGPPDARVCPAAPNGCTPFLCAGRASCYYHCTSPTRVWGEAQARCAALPMGCLVTIDDDGENACIAARASQAPQWIGYQQPNTNVEPAGGWQWKCGASSYATQWANGEPNNTSTNEDCAETFSNGRWNDEACTSARGYICEVP